MQTLKLPRQYTDDELIPRAGSFLTERDIDRLITTDTDAYDAATGALLFKFRRNVIPPGLTELGYRSFEKSITLTEGRGLASGYSGKRLRKDGTYSNTTVGAKVLSGNVGFMDNSAMIRYCRKTAFARDYFDKYTVGIPFIQAVDKLYAALCPAHYERQIKIARGTNRNYVIADTAFTTVTVNKNFQTAVHKDAGDYPAGFGNLCVYRAGHYDGAYFCLPEWRVGIDLQQNDMLFVDVHRWHGNTPFINAGPDFLRVAFVMYYREYMYKCKQPAQELQDVKMEQGGFLKL